MRLSSVLHTTHRNPPSIGPLSSPSEAVSVSPTAVDVVSGSGSEQVAEGHPSDVLSLAHQLITALEGGAHSFPPVSAPGPSHPPTGRCYANGGITIKENASGATPPPKC